MKIFLAVAVALASVAGVRAQTDVPAFETLVLIGRERLAATTSLRARFVETTESALLLEPVVSSGTVVAVEPGRVVMTYAGHEPRRVIIDSEQLVIHWPARGEIETLGIVEIQARVQRYFVEVPAAELRRSFDVEVARDPGAPGTYLITMAPTRSQIREAVSELRIWFDRETALMARLWLRFSNGDTRDFRFEDVQIDVPVDEGLFTVEAPDGP